MALLTAFSPPVTRKHPICNLSRPRPCPGHTLTVNMQPPCNLTEPKATIRTRDQSLPSHSAQSYHCHRVLLSGNLGWCQQLSDCLAHGGIEASPADHDQHLILSILRAPHLHRPDIQYSTVQYSTVQYSTVPLCYQCNMLLYDVDVVT